MKKNKTRRIKKSQTIFSYYIKFFISIYLVCTTIFSIMLLLFVSDYWENQKQDYLHNTVDIAANFLNKNDWTYKENSKDSENIVKTLKYLNDVYNSDIFITSANTNYCEVIYCSDCRDGTHKVCEKHSNIKIPGEYIISVLSSDYFTDTSTLGNNYEKNIFIAAKKILSKDGTPEAIIFTVQPVSEGLKPYINSFLRIYFSLTVILLAVIYLFVYAFSYNRMVKPMRNLGKATEKFTNGDFSYRIKMHHKNSPIKELENVEYSFNLMAESLEKLEKQRNSFIANVSHELKTPMTTIGGFIDGILDGTIKESEQTKYLNIISDEVKRLSRLVISMLNMSKIESGELRLNLTKVNLNDLLIKIFIGFEKQIENKHISVKNLDNLSNINIDADPDMINQVFYNIIDNAVKFTDFAGTISVYEYTNDEDDTVSVAVRNTGKGISEKDLDSVFDRFFKGDKSRSLDAKSSGLGLFIVKSIVNLHGGNITVESIEDEYTEFKVTLKIHLI